MQFALSAPFSSDIELVNSELTHVFSDLDLSERLELEDWSLQNPTRTHRTDITELVAQ